MTDTNGTTASEFAVGQQNLLELSGGVSALPSFQIALVGGRLNVEGSFALCDEVDSFIEALQVAAAGHLSAAEPVQEAPRKKKKRRAGNGAWRKVTPGSFADQVLKAAIKLKTDDPQRIAKAIGRDNVYGIPMAISNMRKDGLLNGVAASRHEKGP